MIQVALVPFNVPSLTLKESEAVNSNGMEKRVNFQEALVSILFIYPRYIQQVIKGLQT